MPKYNGLTICISNVGHDIKFALFYCNRKYIWLWDPTQLYLVITSAIHAAPGILVPNNGSDCSTSLLLCYTHNIDVIMTTIASQITSPTVVYSTVYPGADQRKHQSSASLAFVRGIHRWPVNSPHKWPVTRKMFPFDDVIMQTVRRVLYGCNCLLCPMWIFGNT